MEFPNMYEMYQAYEQVRKSAKYNMLDSSKVVKDMLEIGGPDVVMPLLVYRPTGYRVNRKAYAEFIKEVAKIKSVGDKLERS